MNPLPCPNWTLPARSKTRKTNNYADIYIYNYFLTVVSPSQTSSSIASRLPGKARNSRRELEEIKSVAWSRRLGEKMGVLFLRQIGR
jgi:hypothetical protein